jgi:hypothetical protein
MFKRYGFTILKAFSPEEVQTLDHFAQQWLYRLLSKWTAGKEDSLPLSNYHIWEKKLGVDHASLFGAKNRYLYPDPKLKAILFNAVIENFLKKIGVQRYEIWDDGWGWLGFRFIRPGVGDGYPLSCRDWGVAKGAISCWLPIIGLSSKETLKLVPGSHLKEYEKYLPMEGKFTKGEYRLAGNTADLEIFNPTLDPGEVIFYHSRTLHSEDVAKSDITRLNLEFRIIPK